MKRKLTIRLDARTAAWIRTYAARRNTSVSGIVHDMLAEKMQSAREYEAARRHFMSRTLRPLTEPGERYPTRDELYGSRDS